MQRRMEREHPERQLQAARRILVTTHQTVRSELEPLRAACRRDAALRPLAAHLERAGEQIALLGALGERFASLAIEHDRDLAWLRDALDEVALEETS